MEEELNPQEQQELQQEYYAHAGELPEMKEAFAEIRKLQQGEEEALEEAVQEAPEESQEDRVESEGHEPEIVPEKELVRKKKTPSQYRQEKYAIIAERERLRQENEQLRKEVQQKEYEAKLSYGENIYGQLEGAMSEKKKALEDGDVDGIVKADLNFQKAQLKVSQLEEWISSEKSRLEKEEKSSRPSQEDERMKVIQQISYDWLQENPDLNPNSIYYQAEKAKEVAAFTEYFDKHLTETNQQDLFFTPQYFEQIEAYKEKVEEKMREVASPPNEERSSPSSARSSVAPVRNTGASSVSTSQRRPTVTLTPVEKRMAYNAGLSEQEWLKYKVEQMKEEGKYA